MSESGDKLVPALRELERFSPEEALAALDVLERKRRTDYYIKYWQPITADQRRIFTEIFRPDIKILIVTGGNRSGKTEVGSFLTGAWALGKSFFQGEPAWELVKDLPIPEPPSNIWVVGLDFATMRDVIWREKLRFGKTHPPIFPKGPELLRTNDSDFQAFFRNGSIVTGKSADSGPEKFQGASVNLVWLDEECDEDVFNESYQRTVDCAGKLIVTLTPLVDTTSIAKRPWIFNLVQALNRGQKDIAHISLSVLDNPIVSDEEKTKLLDKWRGHAEEGARLYGHFIRRAGLVYNTWDIRKHFIAPFKIPSNWPRVVSIDPAPTAVTAALWGAISPEGNLYLYREYYQSDLPVSAHAKSILVRNGGDPIDIWLLDPFWGSQKSAESHRTGLQLYREALNVPIRLAPRTEDFGVNVSIEYVSATGQEASRQPKLYVFNDLHKFRWEIEQYVWDKVQRGEHKGQSKEKPRKGNDHLMNAFQYLCSIRPRGRAGSPNLKSEAEMRRYAELNSYTIPLS